MAQPLDRGNAPAIAATRLTRKFGTRTILDKLDIVIERGEFVALLGRSGSGKSTLLRAIAGLDESAGRGGELQVASRTSVIFQDARLLPWKRVLDNVILGLKTADARNAGRTALMEVELAERESAWPSQLSGGEQQRVSLARCLVREPELLLADEPFGALDALTRMRMHDLLRQLCARHRPAVLLVTHDVDEAIALADRVLILDKGRIALDRKIEISGADRYADTRFTTIRAELLRHLGVEDRRAAA